MRYFIIAGEASGDLHGARLMESILKQDPGAEFAYWGGDSMLAVAPGLRMHYREVSIMGFIEVLMKIRQIRKNLLLCQKHILDFKPDVFIAIDFPGFNLRMVEFAKQQGLKTVYYIAPKIWAWNEKRGKKLEAYVDLLLLIFPFESEYFKKWKVRSVYVGNPLIETIQPGNPSQDDRKRIVLMPGSRQQEILRTLPIMAELSQSWPQHQFHLAAAPGIAPEFYEYFRINDRIKIEYQKTYELLATADAAIVCSGTATLETALFRVPQVCVYVGSPISMFLAKQFVKVKYISLVNLILNRLAITELIQEQYTLPRLQKELSEVMDHGIRHNALMASYDELRNSLGESGATDRAALEIHQLLR